MDSHARFTRENEMESKIQGKIGALVNFIKMHKGWEGEGGVEEGRRGRVWWRVLVSRVRIVPVVLVVGVIAFLREELHRRRQLPQPQLLQQHVTDVPPSPGRRLQPKPHAGPPYSHIPDEHILHATRHLAAYGERRASWACEVGVEDGDVARGEGECQPVLVPPTLHGDAVVASGDGAVRDSHVLAGVWGREG